MAVPAQLSAEAFLERLHALSSEEQRVQHQRYFKTGKGEYAEGDRFLGVRFRDVFDLAKEFIELPPPEIDKLLNSPYHEARAGGLSIMDKQARRKKTPESRRKELYDLYLQRHDRINNWDLVDAAAPHVIGRYLQDKPRDILYTLARSPSLWERRTAMVSTLYLIREGDMDDAFRIAGLLLHDDQDLIHKAVGWALRAAGDSDRPRLLAFLDRHAATMPRTALRYAVEHLEPDLRRHYMGLKKAPANQPTVK